VSLSLDPICIFVFFYINNMEVFNSAAELNNAIKKRAHEKTKIGFVPTMGALHQGHISLVKRSVSENDITVVSIFVNPTQFNDKSDLANYPRTLDKDLALLSENGCDFVFAPSVEEMYPEPDTRKFAFGPVEEVMEGKQRPGHFNGVGQVVSKLFAVVPAQKAYFGEKDFQQVAVIRKLVEQLHLPVEIVPCPIFREKDGLAMSSRNMLLSEVQRKNAPVIYQTLKESTGLAQSKSLEEVRNWVIKTIDENPELETEYYDIVDELTLQSINSWKHPGGKIGCIAVKVGKIRLIDNIRYNL
jgi:pantoate--beta-alanine ligase